jgi:imidazolonepropionase-like amidohydrolase
MSRRLAVSVAALAAALATQAHAQNLTITNARVIVGDGRVIENGSLVVRGGKIASVTPGAAPAGAPAQRIDATGFTLIAGYIDGHRHLIQGNPDAFLKNRAEAAMRELLEAGVTTVQSGGDNDAGILALKKMVESGQIRGPRIITSGRVPTANLKSEDEVRAAVRKVVAAGADSIAEVHYPITEPPSTNKPTEQESKNLAAAIDEARKLGVEFQIHASAPDPMVQAVKLGGRKLVHTPHFFWVTPEQAKAVKDSGAWVDSCAGFGAPVFDVFNRDNKPTFRDGKPWPEGIINSEGRGQEAGMKPINGRTLFDAGVPYGFCTDTTYWAPAAVAHEIKTLSLVFSPIDLVKVMGQNSADFVNLGKELGTLEVGKTADVLVLPNNPIENSVNFNNPVVVIRSGQIVVDRRAELKTVRELPYRRPPVYVAPPPAAGRAPAGD